MTAKIDDSSLRQGKEFKDAIAEILDTLINKNLILSAMILDNDGMVITRAMDKTLEPSIEDDLLKLYDSLEVRREDCITYYEGNLGNIKFYGLDLTSVDILMKTIKKGIILVMFVPDWADLPFLVPEIYQAAEDLSKRIIRNESPNYTKISLKI